jgi:hypothetical protein
MKVINDTGSIISYEITKSGVAFERSNLIASGFVNPNSATEFQVPNAGLNPMVYVHSVSAELGGNIVRQAANGNSVLRIDFTEE